MFLPIVTPSDLPAEGLHFDPLFTNYIMAQGFVRLFLDSNSNWAKYTVRTPSTNTYDYTPLPLSN